MLRPVWSLVLGMVGVALTKSLFEARDQDFVKATHRIHRSAKYPSRVDVAIAGTGKRER